MLDPRSLAPGLLALSLAVGSPSAAAQGAGVKPPAQELVRTVRVAPGQLKGRVLASGTRAPVDGQTITVRTMEGDEVAKVTTKPDGTYEIPNLPEGDYVVNVGDSLRVDLSVAPDATINSLDIVMPPGSGVPAAPPAGGAGPAPMAPSAAGKVASAAPAAAVPAAGGGLGVVGWGLIVAGATAAVAVPIAIAANNDDENTVSGAGSRIRR